MLNFFVRFAQLPIHPVALGKESISGSNDDGEEGGVEKLPSVDMQEQAFDRSNTSNREQARPCGGLAFDAKRQHRSGKNKEGTRAAIDGLVQKSEQHHAGDVRQGARVRQRKQAKIQEE